MVSQAAQALRIRKQLQHQLGDKDEISELDKMLTARFMFPNPNPLPRRSIAGTLSASVCMIWIQLYSPRLFPLADTAGGNRVQSAENLALPTLDEGDEKDSSNDGGVTFQTDSETEASIADNLDSEITRNPMERQLLNRQQMVQRRRTNPLDYGKGMKGFQGARIVAMKENIDRELEQMVALQSSHRSKRSSRSHRSSVGLQSNRGSQGPSVAGASSSSRLEARSSDEEDDGASSASSYDSELSDGDEHSAALRSSRSRATPTRNRRSLSRTSARARTPPLAARRSIVEDQQSNGSNYDAKSDADERTFTGVNPSAM
jgi:hypothetical protein